MGKRENLNILRIAVVIPCLNEQAAIGKVVEDFKKAIPQAEIHIFNNASTDNTALVAEAAGAIVHHVRKRGKGNVVRAMFRDVDADYYIMVDGDGTYPAERALEMLEIMLHTQADMMVGSRMGSYGDSASRAGHYFGNRLITRTVNLLFNAEYHDLLSGYRVLSRRFVKSVPLFSKGFEVETTLSIHAVEVDAKIIEYPIEYRERTAGTESKLSTVRDGFKIAMTILALFRDYRPKYVYGGAGVIFCIAGLIVGVPVILEYFQTGLVPRFPSAILASGLMVLGFLSVFTGIIVGSISNNRKIIKKLSFLSIA